MAASTESAAPGAAWKPGPITASRLRRTQALYAAVLVAGALPWLLNATPAWKAAGLGLWLPGAGFIALGPWGLLGSLFTFALFALALFAWFAAGAIIAPLLVWTVSAALAGALVGEAVWVPSPYVAAAATVAVFLVLFRRSYRQRVLDSAAALQRAALTPAALAEVRARTAAQPDLAARELTDEELSGARYLLDRALQPIECFDGFDCVDIFQTASVRYQINFLGYALSQLQQLYAPNFHGYLALAQRNAIEKYLQRRVWDYWIYESCWGHLNFTNWDPAGRDNIMLTGYYGAQVSLYCGAAGDARYSVPGSLTFRLNDRKSWPHDVHSITRSVYENFRNSAYCFYPCEPNWIYSGCNFRGMTALAAHDRAFGTSYVSSILPRWLEQLDLEFTDRAGGVVGLRSSLTGIVFPFPSSELSYCTTANVFAPERAERMWAHVQSGMRRVLGEEQGRPIFMLPNKGVDFGNYRPGNLGFAMGALLAGAREFGDADLAEAALNTLDLRCERVEERGVVHYRKASNFANLYVAAARFARTNDYRDVFTKAPSPAALNGPLLSEAGYPDVLVARAVSNGVDLDLVLVPGGQTASSMLVLSRLVPGAHYQVADRPDLAFVADADGAARLQVALRGRTRLHISPRGD